MKIELKIENTFYCGWTAYFFGLARDLVDDEVFQMGWDTGFETVPIIGNWEDVDKQARMGRLYMAFLAELDKNHIQLTLNKHGV